MQGKTSQVIYTMREADTSDCQGNAKMTQQKMTQQIRGMMMWRAIHEVKDKMMQKKDDDVEDDI